MKEREIITIDDEYAEDVPLNYTNGDFEFKGNVSFFDDFGLDEAWIKLASLRELKKY